MPRTSTKTTVRKVVATRYNKKSYGNNLNPDFFESKEKEEKSRKFKPASRIILVITVVILISLLLYFKNIFIAAMVNNQPITRWSIDRELEKQGGQQVLEAKITEALILQEGQKQKINISQADIDEEIKKIEEQVKGQGQDLDSLLKLQGQTREGLVKQIKMKLIVEKIIGRDLQISDEKVKEYFDQNKTIYPKGTTFEAKKDEIKTQLFQQEMATKFQTWLEDIKKQAKIYYFLQF